MSIEERCIRLIFDADPKTLKYWVDNDMSMIQNLEPGDKILFQLLLPLLRKLDLNADRVLFFLKQHKYNLYEVVTKDWIQKQIDELNGKV